MEKLKIWIKEFISLQKKLLQSAQSSDQTVDRMGFFKPIFVTYWVQLTHEYTMEARLLLCGCCGFETHQVPKSLLLEALFLCLIFDLCLNLLNGKKSYRSDYGLLDFFHRFFE